MAGLLNTIPWISWWPLWYWESFEEQKWQGVGDLGPGQPCFPSRFTSVWRCPFPPLLLWMKSPHPYFRIYILCMSGNILGASLRISHLILTANLSSLLWGKWKHREMLPFNPNPTPRKWQSQDSNLHFILTPVLWASFLLEQGLQLRVDHRYRTWLWHCWAIHLPLSADLSVECAWEGLVYGATGNPEALMGLEGSSVGKAFKIWEHI